MTRTVRTLVTLAAIAALCIVFVLTQKGPEPAGPTPDEFVKCLAQPGTTIDFCGG